MERYRSESIDSFVRTLLRELRIDAGLRQSDLAELLGCPQSFVSKYEIGDRELSLSEARQICLILGTSLPEFVQRLERTIIEAK